MILELPNGENRDNNVPPSFQFNVEGRPASVTDLRKGMKVSAEKIVEEPRTEIRPRPLSRQSSEVETDRHASRIACFREHAGRVFRHFKDLIAIRQNMAPPASAGPASSM